MNLHNQSTPALPDGVAKPMGELASDVMSLAHGQPQAGGNSWAATPFPAVADKVGYDLAARLLRQKVRSHASRLASSYHPTPGGLKDVAMKITLTVSEGSSRTVVVDAPEFLIGRAADCDLQLRNSMVSRHHCVLTVQDGHVFVRDLNSSNGTGVNNQALVGELPLRNGDSLWVATTPIEVRIQSDRAAWMDQVFRAFRHATSESARSPEKAAVG